MVKIYKTQREFENFIVTNRYFNYLVENSYNIKLFFSREKIQLTAYHQPLDLIDQQHNSKCTNLFLP